jgi:3-hydroxy-9,10-secoandrosta-1,3,5(10)-triene-9,17-dione monooxygenase
MNKVANVSRAPTPKEVIACARAMIPVLIERAPRQQAARRILDETMADMKAAGLFRILQPKRYGGYEMSPRTFFDVQFALAEGDTSVGWVFGILGVHSFHLALFDDRAADDVWAENSDALIASPYSPGKAVPVEGGYRLTGHWKFSSGTEHCDWIFLGGVVDHGDKPGHFLDADFRTFLLPRKDYQIIDTWKVVGLKGTGSQDVVVDGAFVPEHRTHKMKDATEGTNPGSAVNTSALYRYPYWQIFLRAVSTAAIGGLQGMVNAFIEYGSKRVSVTGAKTIFDPEATLALAEARAGIDEMRATLRRNFHRMAAYADAGTKPSLDDRLLFKFQCVSTAKRCATLALPLFEAAGGSGIFESQPFGRYYTDIVAMGNHVGNSYRSAGRNWGGVMMGLESTDTLF